MAHFVPGQIVSFILLPPSPLLEPPPPCGSPAPRGGIVRAFSPFPTAGLFSPHGGVRRSRRGVFWFVRIIQLLEPPPSVSASLRRDFALRVPLPGGEESTCIPHRKTVVLWGRLKPTNWISRGFATIPIQATNPDIPCAMYSSSGTDYSPPVGERAGTAWGVFRCGHAAALLEPPPPCGSPSP